MDALISSLLTPGWEIAERGMDEKLKVWQRTDRPIESAIIVDGGSNTFKAKAWKDIQTGFPKTCGDAEAFCGLSRGTKPDDPNMKLSKSGKENVLTKFVRRYQDLRDEVKPDAVLIMCTEAVRSALANPRQTESTQEFLGELADGMGIPADSINILSPSMEARMAAIGALSTGFHDGMVFMIGGGSTECAEVRHGKIYNDHLQTLRMGMRNLEGQDDIARIVRSQFDNVDWLRRSPLAAGYGGIFRLLCHIVTQRNHHANLDARIPFGGWSYPCDKKFIGQVEDLIGADYEQIFAYSFGAKSIRHLRREKIDGHIYVKVNGAFFRHHDFMKVYKGWKERANDVNTGAIMLREIIERVQPRVFTFGSANMRRSALSYIGLG